MREFGAGIGFMFLLREIRVRLSVILVEVGPTLKRPFLAGN